MLPKSCHIPWRIYTARERNFAGEKIANQLTQCDWSGFFCASNSDTKAECLKQYLEQMIDACIPLKTYRLRSNDPPWMTHGIRRRIEKSKAIFATDKKRSEKWKKLKKLTDTQIQQKNRFC